MIEYSRKGRNYPFPIFLSTAPDWEPLKTLEFPSKYSVLLLLADYNSTSQDQLTEIAFNLVKRGIRSVFCWGKNSNLGHISFDLGIIEQPEFEEDSLDIPTADYDSKDQSFEEALWYTLNCAMPDDEYWDECSTVIINLGQAAPQVDLESCLSDLKSFDDRLVST